MSTSDFLKLLWEDLLGNTVRLHYRGLWRSGLILSFIELYGYVWSGSGGGWVLRSFTGFILSFIELNNYIWSGTGGGWALRSLRNYLSGIYGARNAPISIALAGGSGSTIEYSHYHGFRE